MTLDEQLRIAKRLQTIPTEDLFKDQQEFLKKGLFEKAQIWGYAMRIRAGEKLCDTLVSA